MLKTHHLDHGRSRLVVSDGVPDAWACQAWDAARQAARGQSGARFELPLPEGAGHAVVKVYARKGLKDWWHSRSARRAMREGDGYVALSRLQIPCAQALMWGQTRHRFPADLGVVVTVKVEALPCHLAYKASHELALLEACTDELVRLHEAGVTHGDAAARNWFATRPRPTVFDLASWGPLTPERRDKDLVRFLASIEWLAGAAEARRQLERYERQAGLAGAVEAELLAAAAVRAALVRRG